MAFKFFWISFFFVISLQSQSAEVNFQNIIEAAMPLIEPLKVGNIEGLEKVDPPKDTWLYSKLLEYKKTLEKNKDSIVFGKFVKTSNSGESYGVNFFAYSKKENRYHYYLVAVISIDVTEKKYRINNSYLFTEEKSLKDWWMNTYQFYKSTDLKKIPKKYLHPTCPPPTFVSD